MVDIYWNTKHRGIYLALCTDCEGDSCFSIYQNNGIKMQVILSKKQYDISLFSIFSKQTSDYFEEHSCGFSANSESLLASRNSSPILIILVRSIYVRINK